LVSVPWLEELQAACADAPTLADALRACVDGLRRSLPHFGWVGAYMVAGRDLVLGPWTGPAATEHVRIPIGTGVCGAAAASGRTEVVDDVNVDPRYLACFLQTRAELVVPIARGGRVYGEIDVDSDRAAAFTPADVEAVEALCAVLARRAEAEGHDFHQPEVLPA
jgi:L-methionine (R)-S-oxide reductase